MISVAPSVFSSLLGPPRYDPIKSDWEVQGKHGRGWTASSIYSAVADLTAARRFRRNHGYKTVRVRSADIPDKWRIVHFTNKKRC